MHERFGEERGERERQREKRREREIIFITRVFCIEHVFVCRNISFSLVLYLQLTCTQAERLGGLVRAMACFSSVLLPALSSLVSAMTCCS